MNWDSQESGLVAGGNGFPNASGTLLTLTITTLDLDAREFTISLVDPLTSNYTMDSTIDLDAKTVTVNLGTDGVGAINVDTSAVETEINTHAELIASGGDATTASAASVTLTRSGVDVRRSRVAIVRVEPVLASGVNIRSFGVFKGRDDWDLLPDGNVIDIDLSTSVYVNTDKVEHLYVEVTSNDDTVNVDIGR